LEARSPADRGYHAPLTRSGLAFRVDAYHALRAQGGY
jgi:hypothetical protein